MTSDQMDLLVEQVKMLAGEIAFSTSNLKRLMDQSANDPDNSKVQVYSLFLIQLTCNFGINVLMNQQDEDKK